MRAKRWVILTAASAVVFLSLLAQPSAALTGIELYQMCNKEMEDIGVTACMSYVRGFTDGTLPLTVGLV